MEAQVVSICFEVICGLYFPNQNVDAQLNQVTNEYLASSLILQKQSTSMLGGQGLLVVRRAQ